MQSDGACHKQVVVTPRNRSVAAVLTAFITQILVKTCRVALKKRDLRRVLVTGSAQAKLLDGVNRDYPGIFLPGDRVTALDVTNGKPDPEPYLKGLAIAGLQAQEAIVIENAPLGVRAGKAAGIFTVAVTTGPVPREAFEKEGADIIFPSMPAFADYLESL
ncbi:validoxylamine A 7'-phosphate phosphatase [Muribaculaceae bacterium]|nr:validoxylamine A 7'-phosphate phosphatase [Muribaculaceae bacterium]